MSFSNQLYIFILPGKASQYTDIYNYTLFLKNILIRFSLGSFLRKSSISLGESPNQAFRSCLSFISSQSLSRFPYFPVLCLVFIWCLLFLSWRCSLFFRSSPRFPLYQLFMAFRVFIPSQVFILFISCQLSLAQRYPLFTIS